MGKQQFQMYKLLLATVLPLAAATDPPAPPALRPAAGDSGGPLGGVLGIVWAAPGGADAAGYGDYSHSYVAQPTAAPTTETMAPTRTETYAPTRLAEAPSYAPTTDTYAPTTIPTQDRMPPSASIPANVLSLYQDGNKKWCLDVPGDPERRGEPELGTKLQLRACGESNKGWSTGSPPDWRTSNTIMYKGLCVDCCDDCAQREKDNIACKAGDPLRR